MVREAWATGVSVRPVWVVVFPGGTGSMNKSTKWKKEEAARPGELKSGPAWYVVTAVAGKERIARDHLVRRGYEVYLPMRLHLDPKGGLSARPFFPRYLFARIDLTAQPWIPILSTIGVKTMLMSGDHPMRLADGLVEYIRAHEEGGFIKVGDKPPRPACRFAQGQRVVVVGGPMAKLEGAFCEPVDGNRVAILLSLLGRDSRVELQLDQVAPLA